MEKIIVLLHKPHSFVDLITNSSTEIYVIDKSKTEEAFKTIIDFLMEVEEIDYESSICKYTDYEYADGIEIPEGYNPDDLYILHASYHNRLLEALMNHFHIITTQYD